MFFLERMSLGKKEKDDCYGFLLAVENVAVQFSLRPVLVGFEFSSWIDLAVKKSS